MKSITLKEFCEKYGYGPHKEKNLSDLAKHTGVSISYISKLYNAKFSESTNGPKWRQLCAYIENYGYNLIIADPLDYMKTNLIKENNKLKERVSSLEIQNELLTLQLQDLESLVKLCKRIIERKKNNAKYL